MQKKTSFSLTCYTSVINITGILFAVPIITTEEKMLIEYLSILCQTFKHSYSTNYTSFLSFESEKNYSNRVSSSYHKRMIILFLYHLIVACKRTILRSDLKNISARR